jgi:hypothetical protein
MRTSNLLSLLWLATPLALGCADQESPLAPVSALLDVQAGNPVVLSARGSGHIHDEVFGDGELRTFSFTALKHADGTTTGNVQLKNRASGVTYRGSVFCLAPVENGIYVIASKDERFGGTDVGGVLPGSGAGLWLVQDNGEGSNADPDRFSQIDFTDPTTAGALCQDLLGSLKAFFGLTDAQASAFVESFMLDIERGNITVKSYD